MSEPKPYSVTTLAERWECSESMIREMLLQGRLRGFKLGGKLWRISAGEVERISRYLAHKDQRTTARIYAKPSSDYLKPAADILQLKTKGRG